MPKFVEMSPKEAVAAFDKALPSIRARVTAVKLIQQFGMNAVAVAEATLTNCSDPERKRHWRDVVRRIRAVTEE